MNRTTIPLCWANCLVAVALSFWLVVTAPAAYVTTTVAGEVVVTFVSGSTAATSSFGVGCHGAQQTLFTGLPSAPNTHQVSLGNKPAGTALDFWIQTVWNGSTYNAFSCDLGTPNPPQSSTVAFLSANGHPSIVVLGPNDWQFNLDDAASYNVDNDDNDLVIRVTVTNSTTNNPPPPPVGGCVPTTQPAQHPFDITRNSLFWFTHPETSELACATLYKAIVQNANIMPVGFLCMPTTYRSTNYVLGAEDALIESLGFYWRNISVTGESRGLQSQHSPASLLCRARKQLAVELIAAIANNVLLGTSPSNATYRTGKVLTNFPPDLIDQAGAAAAGEDRGAIVEMTALLRKFNTSGVTNQFFDGSIECSAWARKKLRSYSQDPTTKLNCPGMNDICETAESVLFPSPKDIFSIAVFTRTVDLRQYTAIGSNLVSACGVSVNGAFWKITPDVATAGRHFTVDTFGSNISTLLSVWSGSCGSLTEVTCSSNSTQFVRSPITFTSDGTKTYYVVGQGDGSVGKLKVRVTSP